MKIGVLAVQGAFIEHEKMIRDLGQESVEIRQLKDLDGIDGLILPGGESTVQGQFLRKLDLLAPLQERIRKGLPVLGTCAGLILLAEKIEGDSLVHLGTLPVTVRRNAYGRQLASFVRTAPVSLLDTAYPMTFIRAPYVTSVTEGVQVLATVDEKIVGVRFRNQIGLAFHPELSDDPRIHAYFLEMCREYLADDRA